MNARNHHYQISLYCDNKFIKDDHNQYKAMTLEEFITLYNHAESNFTKQVRHDLKSFVDFDLENCSAKDMYGRSVNTNTLMNFQQIGDFCFRGHTAGGDWEEPLFFIIYYDGEQMRGYVPTAGNVFYLPEKAAFGTAETEEKDIVHYLKTEFPQYSEEDLTTSVTKNKFYYDFTWIKNDIIHHFNIQNVQTS